MPEQKTPVSGAFRLTSLMYFCSGQPIHFCSGVDNAILLDDDLGGESLRTVFARASNYRTHFAAAQSVVSVGSIKNSVRHDPDEYDFVVPQTGKWVKMSQKRYDISHKCD
jgi:hypothetical protein